MGTSRPGHPALADARPEVFWLDRPDRPAPRPALEADAAADLVVVGGGYSGLWTALLAKERDPGRDVLLVEGGRVGWAASGRNGGFCAASLTHGEANGRARWPREYAALHRLGRENLDEIEADGRALRHRLRLPAHRRAHRGDRAAPGRVAARGRQAPDGSSTATRCGRELDSPTYLAGLLDADETALVDPARLAWGLAEAAESLGVRIVEGTQGDRPATSPVPGSRSRRTPARPSSARQVALGTNVFPSLLRRVEPAHGARLRLRADDRAADARRSSTPSGGRSRAGVGDSANQFHYYRLTADNRILWGGYDAVYHYGRRVQPSRDQRPETFDRLAEHFFETFPQLEGLRFTHRWGGAIDTCTRFCAFFGTAMRGRVAYALGYTGLGVGATRFGAQRHARPARRPPHRAHRARDGAPPPAALPAGAVGLGGIQLTRWSLARADENEGRRNLWLRALDRLGLGFDS